MAEITMQKIADEDFVQRAELRIPIDNPDEVKKAFEIVAAIRKRAIEHVGAVDNDEDGAEDDYVTVDFKTVDGDVAVVEVAMVSL